jgi:CTP:molybdopterin cytidylyltransferase MocA
MTPLPFAAVILAAGRSSRLGRFKPLLQVEGRTLIQRAVALFRQNRIEDIIVVTGHRADDLEAALAPEAVCITRNEDYNQGMFSSVRTGVSRIPPRCEAFFILPVDFALIQPATVGQLIRAFQDHPGRICHPCVDNRRGHPPLIPAGLAGEILDHDGTGGLRRVLQRRSDLALDVAVTDRLILHDIDTPEDLAQLRRMGRMSIS